MGDVRLWGMGAEQVASILRQAGQDSIRLIVARPVDPSVQSFAVRIFCYIIFWRNMDLSNTLQESTFRGTTVPMNALLFNKSLCTYTA